MSGNGPSRFPQGEGGLSGKKEGGGQVCARRDGLARRLSLEPSRWYTITRSATSERGMLKRR